MVRELEGEQFVDLQKPLALLGDLQMIPRVIYARGEGVEKSALPSPVTIFCK